jgi:hypothetical protein
MIVSYQREIAALSTRANHHFTRVKANDRLHCGDYRIEEHVQDELQAVATEPNIPI